jgi:hypothetical protein
MHNLRYFLRINIDSEFIIKEDDYFMALPTNSLKSFIEVCTLNINVQVIMGIFFIKGEKIIGLIFPFKIL